MKNERQGAIDLKNIPILNNKRKSISNIENFLSYSSKDFSNQDLLGGLIFNIKNFLFYPSKDLPISNFERDLFIDGVYIFNPKEEKKNLKNILLEIRNDNEYMVDLEITNYNWKLAFSGIIPKRWEKFGNVVEDFERARNQKIQLSPMLVVAGITHCHPHVVHMAGITQELSGLQEDFIRKKYEIGKISRSQCEEILEAQGTHVPIRR